MPWRHIITHVLTLLNRVAGGPCSCNGIQRTDYLVQGSNSRTDMRKESNMQWYTFFVIFYPHGACIFYGFSCVDASATLWFLHSEKPFQSELASKKLRCLFAETNL